MRGQTGPTELAGQIDVVRLVDLSSQRLKLNIEYDAAALKAAGQVTLRLDAGLSDEELWALTNRVLVAHGFATVRVPGKSAYSVVKLADAPGLAGIADAAPSDPAAGYRTAVVRAKNRPTKELIDIVSKVLSKPGGTAIALKEGAEGGLIMISDVSARVDQALALLDRLDVPTPESRIEEVPVHFFPAQQLATMVAQVSAKRDAVSGDKTPGEVLPSSDGTSVLLICDPSRSEYWKGLIVQLDRREQAVAVTYTPKTFPAKDVGKLVEQMIKPAGATEDRWRLVLDDLTGSLIVTATPSQQEQIRALIERLDAVPSAAHRPVRSFVIHNRPVREIQSILEQLVQSGVLSAQTQESAATATEAPVAGTAPWPPAA